MKASFFRLADYERDILDMTSKGETAKTIARKMGKEEPTISNARSRLIKQFKANNMCHLVAMYVEHEQRKKYESAYRWDF